MKTSCKYLVSSIATLVVVAGFCSQAMAEELLTTTQTHLHIRGDSSHYTEYGGRLYFEGEQNSNVFGVGFYETFEGQEVPFLFFDNILKPFQTIFGRVRAYGFEAPLPPMTRFVVIIDDGDRIICSRNEITDELSFGIGGDIVFDSDNNPNFTKVNGVIGLPTFFEYDPCFDMEWVIGLWAIEISSSMFDCTDNADCDDGLFCNGVEVCVQSASEEPGWCESSVNPCDADQVCDEELDMCVMPECEIDADCDDGLFCNGEETCFGEKCFSGCWPCFWSDISAVLCYEALDQCIYCDDWDFDEEAESGLDLDLDCFVDEEDGTLLKLRQKTEKTDCKNRHKAEKAELKAAIGSSGDCDAEWDLDDDCDVDKEDAKLLKLRQKEEKADLKARHKTEKGDMKAALQ